MWQGTPMTFEGAAKATTVEGQEQTIARGVTAGWCRSSSSAPTAAATSARTPRIRYENPTPLSNFVETWSITIIPMAMVVTLGYMVGRRRLAVVIFATMLAIYLPMVAFGVSQESRRQPGDRRDGRRSVDRLDGRQGGALRRRPVGAVGGDDDR